MIDYLKLAKDLRQTPPDKIDDNVLIVDFMNMFRRNFSVIKQTHIRSGVHIGGLIGTLRSLRHEVENFHPTRVIIAREGEHSRRNREMLNSNYKSQRQYTAIKHEMLFDTKEDEYKSLDFQKEHFFEYASYLPVQVFKLFEQEADDTIAFIANTLASRGSKVTIVSTDRDFLQLVSNQIRVYDPKQKITFTPEKVLNSYHVTPQGFILQKIMTKDTSDNIQGIRGIGKKTSAKLINSINGQKTLQNLLEYCKSRLDDKVCRKVLYHENVLRTNWELMNLIETKISGDDQKNVVRELDTFKPELNTLGFELLSETDEITHYISSNITNWLYTFRYLEKVIR